VLFSVLARFSGVEDIFLAWRWKGVYDFFAFSEKDKMKMNPSIAHVKRESDGSWAEPHSLSDHLRGTAHLAEKFAAAFSSGSWVRACAFGYDTKKASADW
jgi:hypothetical protein